MKKTFLAGFALVAFTLASCTSTTNEENTTMTDSTTLVEPAMGGVETTTMDATTTTTTTTQMDEKGNPMGTTYKSNGEVDKMGTNMAADGMHADGNTTNSAAKGETITLDGKVNDRDHDGKVGTAEVKEDVKSGAKAVGNAVEKGASKVGNAVKKGANEVKGEYKDVRDGQNNH